MNYCMTGKELKTKLSACGVSQSEIARRLDMSQQSFNQSLIVNDVKSGLLERIASAIGVDMSFFYPTEGSVSIAGNNNISGNNNAVGNVTVGDNSAVLQERVTMLEKLLEEKERTIKILMEK